MSGKRKESNSEVHGAPDIAHPSGRHRAFIRALLLEAPRAARDRLKAAINELLPYEKQVALVYAWFFEMLDCAEGHGPKRAARNARLELQTLFLNLCGQLLRVAQSKKRSNAKKWAGKLLANIYKSIEKHDKKLREANADYLTESAKIGSKSVTSALFPKKKSIARIVHHEWKKAERHWKRLLLLKAGCVSEREQKRRQGLAKEHGFQLADHERGTTLKQAAEREKIPRAYWPLVKFSRLSTKSEPHFWEVLWPIIQEKIDLSKMPPLKVREYDKERWRWHKGNPMSLPAKRYRKRYLSDVETNAHDHFRLLVRVMLGA